MHFDAWAQGIPLSFHTLHSQNCLLISTLTQLIPFSKTHKTYLSVVSTFIFLAALIALLTFSWATGGSFIFHDNHVEYLLSNKYLVFLTIASTLLMMLCAKYSCIHNWNFFIILFVTWVHFAQAGMQCKTHLSNLDSIIHSYDMKVHMICWSIVSL